MMLEHCNSSDSEVFERELKLILTIFQDRSGRRSVSEIRSRLLQLCALADQPDSVDAVRWRIRLEQDFVEAVKVFDL